MHLGSEDRVCHPEFEADYFCGFRGKTAHFEIILAFGSRRALTPACCHIEV